MKRFHYNIIFRQESEGGFTVSVPSLPGCISYGKDLSEAKKNIQDAINGYIISLSKHNESIPNDNANFMSSMDFEFVSRKKTTYA